MTTRTITCTLTTPVPSITGTATIGGYSDSAKNVPKITAASTATHGAIPAVPMITAVGVAFQGAYSSQSVPRILASGTTAALCGSSAKVPRILAVAKGYSGVVINSSVSLPLILATSEAFIEAVGTSVSVRIPLILAHSTAQQTVTQLGGIVMHTEKQAFTTYTNYPFNSFARFNGVYLAAGDGGVFALSGATDDGAFIDAAARVGITDFGSSRLKKVDRMYVGYRADGDMVLRVITDEINVRDYALKATGKTGMHGNHVRIGKGIQARYFQFELQNKNGSDFELNVMEVKPTVLRRRVGGGDA